MVGLSGQIVCSSRAPGKTPQYQVAWGDPYTIEQVVRVEVEPKVGIEAMVGPTQRGFIREEFFEDCGSYIRSLGDAVAKRIGCRRFFRSSKFLFVRKWGRFLQRWCRANGR